MNRELAIKALTDEIRSLSPTDLEHFGHRFVSIIEGARLNHRGLNLDGRPVGYTIDTFSDGLTIVAEYSSEANYFAKSSNKIIKDIDHALELAPLFKKLYLVSNQIASNNELIYWNDSTNKIHENIVIYDARRLATELYDEINRRRSLAFEFVVFLPLIDRLMADGFYQNSLPQLPSNFVLDYDLLAVLTNEMLNNRVVVIHGLSGSGKTELSLRYAWDSIQSFDNMVWVDSTQLRDNPDLSCIHLFRQNSNINLITLASAAKTLIILDGFDNGFSDSRIDPLISAISKDSRDRKSVV